MMRVRLSREARNDLSAIGSWLAQRNPAAAQRTIETLRQRLRTLAQAPEIGRARPDIRPDLRGHVVSPYLVLYSIGADDLTVVRIVDARRDLLKLFKD